MVPTFRTKRYLHISRAQITRRIRFFMNFENLSVKNTKRCKTRLQFHSTWQKPFLVFRLRDDAVYSGRVWLFHQLLTARTCTSAGNAELAKPYSQLYGPYRLPNTFSCFPFNARPSCVCMPSHTWCVQVLRSPKEASAAAMQSWRERCEKCVCLQGDYVEKWLHFQLPVMSSFFK